MILDHAVILAQKLQHKTHDAGYSCGDFLLTIAEVDSIVKLKEENLIEILNTQNEGIDSLCLNDHIGEIIKLEIKTGDINNYFESFADFIEGNKYENKLKDFYISEILYRENIDSNVEIDLYKQNLLLISFLRQIADTERRKGSALELLFYRSGQGTDLILDYNLKDLKYNQPSDILMFKAHFEDAGSGEDKKQLFVNELVNFINSCGNSYIHVANNWDILTANYKKSVMLFIAGFSFEKIKTSSNDHFQKLVDKISESIGKAATYIFGVPVGYILLLNGMDYSGLEIGKNFILLLLGLIFFILIWNVLFKNIGESIQNIQSEIDDFLDKINNVPALDEIKNKLHSLKSVDLKKQRKKLFLVQVLSTVILSILIAVYLFIFFDVSIFYL